MVDCPEYSCSIDSGRAAPEGGSRGHTKLSCGLVIMMGNRERHYC